MGNLSVVDRQKEAESDDRSIEVVAQQVEAKEGPALVHLSEGERDLSQLAEDDTNGIDDPGNDLGVCGGGNQPYIRSDDDCFP